MSNPRSGVFHKLPIHKVVFKEITLFGKPNNVFYIETPINNFTF